MKIPEKEKKLLRILEKIQEHAIDGQNGSAIYAQDRLCQIRKIVEIGIKKIKGSQSL